MSEAAERLAKVLMGLPGKGEPLVMGKVISANPIRVLVEGNAQDADSLLRSASMDPEEMQAGDMVALWPIEEHQRYVILAKVVEL